MTPTFAKSRTLDRAIVAGLALALTSIPATAICTDMSAAQTRPIVTAFLNRPVGLLERYPFGGPDLVNRLTVILGSDVKVALPSVLELIRSSSHPQKEAIGAALGSTNGACLKYGDSRSADLLRVAVTRMTDTVVRSKFYAISAGITDSDEQKSLGRSSPQGGKSSLPTGRLPNPFAPQLQADPNRPLPPIR